MKRIILLLVIVLLIAIGGWYAYRVLNRDVQPLTEVAADAELAAPELIAAFEQDSATANRQYLGKVLAVTGTVKAVEKDGRSATVILGQESSLSSVRCSMDSIHVAKALALQDGVTVSIKGNCTGYNPDEMGLGADVVLNRCVLINKNE